MLEMDWQLADPLEERAANGLAGWSAVFRQLLHNRGLSTAAEAEAFLYPERTGLNDPFLMAGMDQAVDRVLAALRGEELIAVFGDFDADGLTATALLVQLLRSPELQGRVISYLPHRSREGYGLNPQAVAYLAQQGVRLLITADCGIGADREIALARQLGMDVIVTDHHEVTKGVPPGALVSTPGRRAAAIPSRIWQAWGWPSNWRRRSTPASGGWRPVGRGWNPPWIWWPWAPWGMWLFFAERTGCW